MDKVPHISEPTDSIEAAASVAPDGWRGGLPRLSSGDVVLREMRTADAPALFTLLTTADVARFISPPPSSLEGFERFITWTLRQRAAGAYTCFAVTMKGYDTAIGLFQVRQLKPNFQTAEWGFALGSPFWGTGVFVTGAELVLDFAFDTLRVHRLEARACVKNGRGLGALRKLGASHEAVLRRSFLRDGTYLDQALYTIIGDEWRAARDGAALTPAMSVH